jgi:hypothetical protein
MFLIEEESILIELTLIRKQEKDEKEIYVIALLCCKMKREHAN